MKPSIILLQQRDFGQKINATFDFIGQNFKPLMLALLYIAGPPALIGGLFMNSYESNVLGIQKIILGGNDSGDDLVLSSVYEALPTLLIMTVFLGIANVVSSLAVNAYMLEYEEGNRNITPEIVWSRLKNYIGRGIGYSIVMLICALLATVLLVLPGIYVAVALSFIYIIMMRENLDLGATFQRSFYLIQGKWWSTFGLLLIVGIIAAIIGAVFRIPAAIGSLTSFFKIGDGMNDIWLTINGVVVTVGSVLVRSLVLIAIVFQYYNLVERRDGSGIISSINNIGNNDTSRTDKREEEF
jgi:hypothetical protein